MELYGLEIPVKNRPVLDDSFIPMSRFIGAFEASASNGKDIAVSIEREGSKCCVRRFKIHGTPERADLDMFFVERVVKFLLWQKGGWRVGIHGDANTAKHIASLYRAGGERDFDLQTMEGAYERGFEVTAGGLDSVPEENDGGAPLGGHLEGCRIGFDAGGSDRKVSAVIDGEAVFSEEVVWHPKTQSDPSYHYDGILSAFRGAARHMPRVDAIGVSSAGIFVANRCMKASLFVKVPQEVFDREVKDIYIRAASEFGVPLVVCNDGDVAALAGVMGLKENNVLGIAMGTSEAAGFVDKHGNIRGWLNELAFAPVDVSPDAAIDPWSLDRGVGAMYFSQDAVIKLAPAAGISFGEDDTPAEKLKHVQELMEAGDAGARDIFLSIGVYLGHSLALYRGFYGFKRGLMMGRVMSGSGGNLALETANRVLNDEYPDIRDMTAELPDEMTRRVGQSVAAASLPDIRKDVPV